MGASYLSALHQSPHFLHHIHQPHQQWGMDTWLASYNNINKTRILIKSYKIQAFYYYKKILTVTKEAASNNIAYLDDKNTLSWAADIILNLTKRIACQKGVKIEFHVISCKVLFFPFDSTVSL